MVYARASLLVVSMLALCCARPIYREPETVTPDGAASFWVAGSEGLATYFDGARWHLRDYPRANDAPDWAYEPGTVGSRAARIVMVGVEPVLFTRNGEVLRWDRDRWTRLHVRLPREYGDDVQIDDVLNAPDGDLVIHIHSQTIVWGDLSELATGRYASERTPTYFTWLGFLGVELWGIGWDQSGNVRAAHRRDPRGWQMVARLGEEGSFGEPKCALRGPDNVPLVVTTRAIIDVAGDLKAPVTSVLPVVRAPVKEVLDDGAGAPYVVECFSSERGALLLLGPTGPGREANVLVAQSERWSSWRCDPSLSWDAVGAVARPDGWSVVTRNLRVVKVEASCRPVRDGSGMTIAE